MGLQVKSGRANKMGQYAIPFRCTASRCRAYSHNMSSQILRNLCAAYVQRTCKPHPLTEFSRMSCCVKQGLLCRSGQGRRSHRQRYEVEGNTSRPDEEVRRACRRRTFLASIEGPTGTI